MMRRLPCLLSGLAFTAAAAGQEPALAVYNDLSRDGYKIECLINISGEAATQTAGLVVGYRNVSNYYPVQCDAANDLIRLSAFVDGNETVLVEKQTNFPTGDWFELEITWDHQIFDIQIADETVIRTTDGTLPDAGRIGYWLGAQGRAMFTGINVELE